MLEAGINQHLSTISNHDLFRYFSIFWTAFAHFHNDVWASNNVAEYDVHAIKPWGFQAGDVKLGIVSVNLPLVRHSYNKRLIMPVNKVLVIKQTRFVYWFTPGSISECDITALNHQAGDYPMKCVPFKMQFPHLLPHPFLPSAKSPKVFTCFRAIRVELYLHSPYRFLFYFDIQKHIGERLQRKVLAR